MIERLVTSRSGREKLVRLNSEKLGTNEPIVPQKRSERKFNMRIKRQDLMLLDALAEVSNRPRSELINELLHRILLKELESIEKLDARVLLAMTADQAAAYDPLARPWIVEIMTPDIRFMINNVLEHGNVHDMPADDMAPDDYSPHSEAYDFFKSKIDGAAR